jgi:hypothetical protein
MRIGALAASEIASGPAPAAPARPAGADKASQEAAKAPQAGDKLTLSAEALAVIAKLKARDTEVRQHEQAHLAAAGSLALSGASYVYQRGPDGISYAIGGEVQIDTSPGRTPEETIARAHAIMSAALAPADPSGPDRAVAAQAQQLEQQARAALAQQQAASPAPEQDAPDPLTEAVQRAYGVSAAQAGTINVAA